MSALWVHILISDPSRTESELKKDLARVLAGRGALKRLVANMVVLKVGHDDVTEVV